MKKIAAIVSRGDAEVSGASRIADDLSRLLNDSDEFRSHHWLGEYRGEWNTHFRKLHGGSFLRFLYKASNWFSVRAGFPDFFTPELIYHVLGKRTQYDIYHVHDTARTLSPITLRWISQRKPVVLTFHDCSAFTGGCLYPLGCNNFEHGCGDCPQLKVWPMKSRFDRTRWLYRFKSKAALAGRFIPVTPSEWMADEAMKSGMFPQRPRVIPNSVDTELFQPVNLQKTRDLLDLPRDRFVILLSAHNLEDERKGISDALEAIKASDHNPLLIALGSINAAGKKLFDGIETRFLGFVPDRKKLSLYCSVADILIFPTHADNLPNSVLEAMACGTPVVGYRTGGMPDMVRHEVDGWLAETGDLRGLTQGLNAVIGDPTKLGIWSVRCRQRAVSEFSRETFLNAHINLYNEILDPGTRLFPHLENS